MKSENVVVYNITVLFVYGVQHCKLPNAMEVILLFINSLSTNQKPKIRDIK